MYTLCPECEVAFRVTAEVLKQAAGKVRCGGCGVAFNALAHLSEEMPVAPDSEYSHPDPHPLEVESDEPGELVAGTPPKSISAEQSVALLKTLDDLAGEDIRIEDTGIEWRVMGVDDDEDEELADDPVPSMVHEEMRFDDNTPLPDDFDLDAPSAPQLVPAAVAPEPTPSLEDSQVDLAFGEADEWEDLLDDLEEAAVSASIADESAADPSGATSEDPVDETDISAELATLPDSIEIGPPEAAAEEEPLDMDTQFALQAKEMGIDLSSVHAVEDDTLEEEDDIETEPAPESEQEPEEEEDEQRDTSIDEDLIAAAFEVEAAAKAEASDENKLDEIELDEIELDEIELDEINLEDVAPDDLSRAGILDEDDYLDVITEEDELAEDKVLEELLHEDALEDRVLEQALMQEEIPEESIAEEEIAEDEAPEEDPEEEISDDEAALEADLEQALEGLIEDSVAGDIALSEFAEPEESEVPEPTEEEKTINFAIDQDLFAIAVEDDDGFTSTIVQKQISSVGDIPGKNESVTEDVSDQELSEQVPVDEAFAAAAQDDNPLMETIIMEGESVHNEEELERLEAARKAASLSLKESGFDKDKDSFRSWQPPKYGMAAAAALLFVILIVQVIHHSREALAISPTFQSAIGPVYRMVGRPVTPAWDIRGWRFEATKGSTGEDGQVLTIYSRVGNNSDQTLPYPLVHLSLTDRFEEIVGSRVLEPSEYLFDNADPRRPVHPGETFNAVIAIDSPSSDATGFKLNVCYRLASGQLRCAIEDFK